MSTDGEVANAAACKAVIHGFKSHSVLQVSLLGNQREIYRGMCLGARFSRWSVRYANTIERILEVAGGRRA